ncbi:bifunctional phosphoribosylaminoimidazolecarboxamide formyltransferase/IMP cyclohydrolase [Halobacterium litoreum]|uniref:Bifunctional phosphoribosylaminoimidazolecarboxamide formyltransferase/IMP cyclohydrolase n=1 Tax=Halobacterium litoreum TaxID=2039234 RepID=A0ABD5NHL0_9EURY|nr:bifunctional phosphoribosylaminoimidazolecarboxamide formyltransferase/IMP cyclohydrolase [Halobacterium litoreum]UHH12599.1 bifunctional phosphoribosylaminoimidazolecarboxamide formyltransferase/IMP cyclohydrolase [Halobacterium litoreum]
MTRIAGLASNRGRNLLHVDDLEPGGADLAVVLSNHADAPVLDAAEDRDIPTEVVEQGEDESRRDHEKRVVEALADYDVDFVCLDGYMRVLSETFLDSVPLTLNVHPSLLPAFPGMDAHEQVLDANVSVTGCTVHVVTDAVGDDGAVRDEDVDAGPIVTQEPVPVYADDDRADLKERVLYDAEFEAYPRAIRWFANGDLDASADGVTVDADDGGDFPARRLASADRADSLRYGENPHQDAAVYRDDTCEEASVVHADQLNEGAKALSYNNYNDADAALNLVKEFDDPAAAVIKHTNPAGCATADTLADAYSDALATDAKSAFGGIVALNRVCDAETAERVADSFKEVVVAPGYTDAALDALREKSNLRILSVGELGEPTELQTEKALVGGRLVQERDLWAPSTEDFEVVTERDPTEEEIETMLFAWRVLKHVKSNGILFADGTETVGLGVGQVSRVDAVEIAATKAERDAEGKDADGAVMASDAFFPFPDAVEEAADAGVEAIVQPGGSKNDDKVIDAADEHGMAMVFTGHRCFRHD